MRAMMVASFFSPQCYFCGQIHKLVRPASIAVLLILILITGNQVQAVDQGEAAQRPRLAFVGLHGGVFDSLKQFEEETQFQIDYLTDSQIREESVDFTPYAILFLQHVRGEDREHYENLVVAALERNPKLKIISISGLAERKLSNLDQKNLIGSDPELRSYYGSSPENLRRLLIYVGAKYFGRPSKVLPPKKDDALLGMYHFDHQGMFQTVGEFVRWSEKRDPKRAAAPRAVVMAHSTHLAFQQPAIVEALMRQLEKHGLLVATVVDSGPMYKTMMLEFKPSIVIHTCHSRDDAKFRLQLGVPHLHSIFFKKQSIDDWRKNLTGLASGEMAFHIIGQELLGAIEPQIGAGTKFGGGSAESFTPIPERIEHLVDRAAKWVKLSQLSNREKKIAFVYYDREMGKAELMRGTATGMFMNSPRSIVRVLKRMKADGYDLSLVPDDEDELLELMQDHGRQIGIWAPGELDRLARSGKAILIPVEQYRKWFEEKVPEACQKDIIDRWGDLPGRFLVWEEQGKGREEKGTVRGEKGKQFIVIPRVDLGNVILLPQPLRGEAHDTSLVHDKLVPPPHNYLATYFWLEERFKANALVHFGTHGSEFLLPGKPTGLSEADWPDIVMGTMPNINPWIINNLGESSPVRRRAYAVLMDHLVPPSVCAELSDELLNLHNEIDRWATLEEGILKSKFQKSITEQVKTLHLEQDLKFQLDDRQKLTAEEVEQVQKYLHDIYEETTPVNLHLFGEPPRKDLLVPYLVICLRKPFLDLLVETINFPEGELEEDRRKAARAKAEEIVGLVVDRKFEPEEAFRAVTAWPAERELPEKLQETFELLVQLNEGFARTHEEIDNLMAAFEGRFIEPSPGNSPDRNPAVLPTGRNMYVMNPEEVPSRPSWDLGKLLIDQLLADQLKTKGEYPEKIAFTLNSFATFQDYGVMESQIMYLIGVRPIWNSRNLVTDVELIPSEELKRPRIDVFIAGNSYYRDMLPTRMRRCFLPYSPTYSLAYY